MTIDKLKNLQNKTENIKDNMNLKLLSANHHITDDRALKDRFLEAVLKGKLGRVEQGEIFVTLKEFRDYFSDIKTQYVLSFLPAATFQPGQHSLSHTKFVFRVSKGVYRLHPEVLEIYREKITAT